MSAPIVYIALQQFAEADDRPLRLLREAGFEVRRNTLGRRLRKEDLVDLLGEAEAVLAGVEPYDAEVLASLPRLRCISRCGVGADAIDLEEARRRGIAIYTTADEVVEPVAQMTVAMMFALARNFPQHGLDARSGVWTKRSGVLLSEWTMGLIGFGRIARQVAAYLRVFGPRLLVADPALRASDLPEPLELKALPALLAEADLISIHATRPASEGPMIGRKELAMMRRGSYLVNTARGFLVDEAALDEALTTGRLAGAALDVFQEEPYTGSLASLPNVLCTPHVATLTRASRAAMEWRCAHSVIQHALVLGRAA